MNDLLRRIHRDERGGPMAEYLPLLSVIAIVVIFAISFFGGAVNNLLGGDCPAGQWDLVNVGFVQDSKHNQQDAIEADKDGNGFVCVKSEAADGKGLPGGGNTGGNNNLKDNN